MSNWFFLPRLYNNWYSWQIPNQGFYCSKKSVLYSQLPMNKGQFCLSMGKSDKSIWQLALIVSLKIERGKKSYYFFPCIYVQCIVHCWPGQCWAYGYRPQPIIPYTCSWFIRYVIGWHFRRKKHFWGKIIFFYMYIVFENQSL